MLEVAVSGKLTHGDYQQFIPAFERLVTRHGKIRVLFEMTDFHGWEAAALWDDVKFDLTPFSDIERLAMVGDKQWEKGMSMFCRPFTTATIRYYDVPRALRRYEERLQPAIERQQEAGRRIAKWFVPEDTPHRILRDLATRMSAWPGVAALVKRRMAAESVLGRA